MPYKDLEAKKKNQKLNTRAHYERNREAIKKRAAQLKRIKRAEWYAFKGSFSCIHCGFNHPAALDFHHVDRTNYRSVNKLAQAGNYKAAKDEIKKCVALCANCHRIHHHEERVAVRHKRKAKKKIPGLAGDSNEDVLNINNKEPGPKRRSKKPR
jgi:uncharacterized protein YjhX (UPF0386 family)